MKKETADTLKRQFHNDTTDVEPSAYMSEELFKDSLELLNYIEEYLAREITDYSLDESFDLIDTKEGDLVRGIWFSRGMEDTYICLSPLGEIKGIDEDFPKRLLTQVAKALDDITTM